MSGTDLAERLRDAAAFFEQPPPPKDLPPTTPLNVLLRGAADEIERLRAALDDERTAHQVCVQMRNGAYGEIERLRTALAECAEALGGFIDGYYAKTRDHPAMALRYERDMEPVLRARTLLQEHPRDDGTAVAFGGEPGASAGKSE